MVPAHRLTWLVGPIHSTAREASDGQAAVVAIPVRNCHVGVPAIPGCDSAVGLPIQGLEVSFVCDGQRGLARPATAPARQWVLSPIAAGRLRRARVVIVVLHDRACEKI
jgi:hypothetical protein